MRAHNTGQQNVRLSNKARDVAAIGVPWIQGLICDWPQVSVFSTSLLSGPVEIKFWMELTRMWSSLNDAVGSYVSVRSVIGARWRGSLGDGRVCRRKKS